MSTMGQNEDGEMRSKNTHKSLHKITKKKKTIINKRKS
jgi:hypothetical protein